MELVLTVATVFVSCLGFVIALVSLLLILRIGKGINISVQVEQKQQEQELAPGISKEDHDFLTEMYKQRTQDMDKQQVSIDEVMGALQSFMTGGNGNG